MADIEVVLLIGTRKGLFIARSSGGRRQWQVDPPQLRMEETTAVGVDPRPTAGGEPPRLFAGSSSWVYGTRVLHSDDLGRTWAAVPDDAIRFPERTGTALAKVWQITPGIADGEVWAGTEPSAVFRSTDGGVTFEMNDGLWDHPHRPDWAPGGGGQAVHTILQHPLDPDDVLVAMSTGGVYRTADGGGSWSPYSQGIRADFMPEGQQYPEYGQCVHKVARHPENPDELYAESRRRVPEPGRRPELGLDRGRTAGSIRIPSADRSSETRSSIRVSTGGRRRPVPAGRRTRRLAV